MPTREARLKALGEWFLEVSALLAVFPWLDQVVHQATSFNWRLFFLSISLVLILGGLGLYLVRGEDEE
jgi:uncharacterized membrane protein